MAGSASTVVWVVWYRQSSAGARTVRDTTFFGTQPHFANPVWLTFKRCHSRWPAPETTATRLVNASSVHPTMRAAQEGTPRNQARARVDSPKHFSTQPQPKSKTRLVFSPASSPARLGLSTPSRQRPVVALNAPFASHHQQHNEGADMP